MLFQRGGGLFARVFIANASVMVIAFLVLAFTPVSINRTTTIDQLAVLFAGLVAMLAANAALLRVSLAPLRELTQHMQKIDVLRPEEVLALVRAAESDQDAAIFHTAAFAGLRMGELLALRWRDAGLTD